MPTITPCVVRSSDSAASGSPDSTRASRSSSATVQCNSRLIEKLRGPGLYDSRVAGRWTSILVSLAAAMLLIVLVDGWAIAFLPRVVEKIVISAAFIVLVVVAVQELKGRDRQRA